MKPIKQAIFERTFDAPVQKVWQAWTNPELVKKWWGPNGVTIPECKIDLQVGGDIFIVMEAGQEMGEYKGTKWPMEAKITLLEENSKLFYNAKAWTQGYENETQINQTTELELTPENGKTKMKLTATINNAGPQASMALEGMEWGYNQQFDKLEKFLMNY